MKHRKKFISIFCYVSLFLFIFFNLSLTGQQIGSTPVVSLINPSPSDSLNNSGLTLVRAEIISSSPLTSISILNNEKKAASEAGLNPQKKDNDTYIIESLVPLQKGLNTIYVKAKNSKGISSSEKRNVYCHAEPFVTWILPASGVSTSYSDNFTVKAEIRTDLELKNTSLNINGTIIPQASEGFAHPNNNTWIFEKKIQLKPGKNSIYISSNNTKGTTNSTIRVINNSFGTPVITLTSPVVSDSLNNLGLALVKATIFSKTELQSFSILNNSEKKGAIETTVSPQKKDSSTYIIESLVPLEEGLNNIYLKVKNSAASVTSEKRRIFCQPQPFITWLMPVSANSNAESEMFTVKAEIKTDIDLKNISLNLNGVVLSQETKGITRLNNNTYILELKVQLKAGKNSIYIAAGNIKGIANSSIRVVTNTFGSAPAITLTNPSITDSLNNSGLILVRAEISSKSGLQTFRVFNNKTLVVSGTPEMLEHKDSATYILKNLVPLQAGMNTIYVEAKNSIGSTTSEKHIIKCQLEPIINWILPSSVTSTTGSGKLNIKAEVLTNLDLLNASINLNGNIIALNKEGIPRLNNNTYSIETTLSLNPGVNNIVILGSNPKGTVSSTNRSITYVPAVVAESKPIPPLIPALTWKNPESDHPAVNNSSVDIEMNIKSSVELEKIALYLNGKMLDPGTTLNSVKNENGVFVFRRKVELTPGDNKIFVTVGNISGTTTSDTRTIKYTVPAVIPIAETVSVKNSVPAKTVPANNPAPVAAMPANKPVPTAPAVTWISPSGEKNNINMNAARIKASIKSNDNLKSLLVYVNGVATEEVNLIPQVSPQGVYSLEKTINLQPGENDIYLVATNSTGTTKSDNRYLTNPPANPPVITWANPVDTKAIVNSEVVVIEACIKSATELKLAQIFVNGVQQASEMMFQPSQPGDCNYRLTKPVILKEGDNSLIVIATNFAGSVNSDQRMIRFEKATMAEKRLALILGNSDYGSTNVLKNPVNDANLIEGTLKSLGFNVIKHLNATKAEMYEALREFSKLLPEYNVALLYYAGHGVQVDGQNYLVPTDAKLNEPADCKWEAMKVNDIVEEFEKVPENINIIILDACRNNPFRSWSRGGAQGFRTINSVSGTIISFATAEGSTAADGAGSNGTFTEELVKQMNVPQSLSSVFNNTRKQVMKRTNNQQRPLEMNGLTGDFYFKK